ncbi:MAG: hypothetical protein IPH16_12225 [Haliscomenobacter sp.]|nr:hypothetical protein [Haliscomenobacter sp.]MBK7474543.1 hypothetical protein [Haliscomenobacter sp.]
MNVKRFPAWLFSFVLATAACGQQTILETTIQMADLYSGNPIPVLLDSPSSGFTVQPLDKNMSRFAIQWEDGASWNLRFGEEMVLTDQSGEVLLSSLQGKTYFPIKTKLLQRQVADHGVNFLNGKGEKIFSATRYFEGLFPSSVDIWMKSWTEQPVANELIVVALIEIFRQIYFFEG